MSNPITQGRRSFLKNCAVAGTATTLLLADQCHAGTLTHESFADKVGHRFLARNEADELTYIRLRQVKPLKTSKAGLREPFSLIFEPDAGVELQQDIYHISHRKLGQLRLLLAPVSPNGQQKLEAVFA